MTKKTNDSSTIKFKVGDKVRTAPNSSEIKTMKAVWVAEIYKVIAPNADGGCFETVGRWEPITDESGAVDGFWSDHDANAAPTLRQLWGSDLAHA